MTLGKLKAHKDFGQGNKFQGSLKLLASQHNEKWFVDPVFAWEIWDEIERDDRKRESKRERQRDRETEI
jgi:hypothetical protein